VLKHKGQVFSIKAVVSILGWTWFGDGLPGVNGTLSQARTGSGLSDQRYAHKGVAGAGWLGTRKVHIERGQSIMGASDSHCLITSACAS
jgi:hypothetical protein